MWLYLAGGGVNFKLCRGVDLSLWLTCQPVLQETMVQDLEDMKVSVQGQHHAQLQEACAGQSIPFSFILGYLNLGMCYLLL